MMKNNENVEEQELEAANPGDVLGALFGGGDDTLDKLGVMMIMDDIKNDSVRPAIEWIFKNNLSTSQPEHLTLILNCLNIGIHMAGSLKCKILLVGFLLSAPLTGACGTTLVDVLEEEILKFLTKKISTELVMNIL